MEFQSLKIEKASDLPDKPGIYKFYDQNRNLIYVGKAKSLKKRVGSYFAKQNSTDRKTRKMVSEIRDIEFTIANSEFDALLLENNLIKENQPRYNILLKDDKSFPYILVTNERFPRVFATRRLIQGSGQYFGPYTSVKAMNNVLELIRNLYHIRTCKFNLSEENIEKGKFKVCLEYHIGKCLGPCEKLQTEAEYLQDLEQAINILKGNISPVKHYFKSQMQYAAENLQFEQAQKYKNKLELLDKFQSRSVVVNQKITDVDVFTIVSEPKSAYVNFLKINSGAIVSTKTVEVKKKLDETDQEILGLLIFELRTRYNSDSKQIFTNIPVEEVYEGLEILVPKIGDKKKLVELSLKNAWYYQKEKALREIKKIPREERILKQLQNDLQLPDLPAYIECFDNSNLQGTNPVASMVCFKYAKPSKKDYRHFNIRTVEGPNDFASMYEIVHRRYKRLTDENQELPSLIVIDGGKGQLSSASSALKDLNLYGKIPLIGIAKRLEEIYFPEDQFPVHISKKSESLKLIQQIRDEAHRFAITFHRLKRSKASFGTELEQIPGIGKTTADKLLKHFRSVKKVKEATPDELELVLGIKKAAVVTQHFHNSGTAENAGDQ
jgi:excinuclease ABC subunit C